MNIGSSSNSDEDYHTADSNSPSNSFKSTSLSKRFLDFCFEKDSAFNSTSSLFTFNSSSHMSTPPALLKAANNASTIMDLIPIVNKLQDVFATIGNENLDLPQIVVVGSQSAGKSSVLENIVQWDFLPRGKDICTRRPLILQLVQSTSAHNIPNSSITPQSPRRKGSRDDKSLKPEEFAEFQHLPDKIFTDFNEVRQEIEKETDRLAGVNKGISKVPIHLKITSPKVLNLTLVDLPGITKVPVGEQPPDIEMKIRKLILEYISKPNAIILAVSPANQDLANSEALKIAREVDFDGKRTIGVLTKLDLMDAGTNAADILLGKIIPLKLGFVGVVNRSQQDIISNKPIAVSLKYEMDFFQNHPSYRGISTRCGTPYLVRTLNAILMHHIRDRLPELKSKLNILLVQTEQELTSYGDATFTGKAHQGSLVLRLLTRFASNFSASIDGTFSEISTTELCGGARLYYIFNSIFNQTLESIDPCGGLSVQDIRTAIRNSTGPRPSLFIPEVAFDLLIKPQIKRLELPSLRCVELVFDEMLKIVNGCETKELLRFPKLHQRVVEVVVELLRERMAPTQAYIESLVSIQLAYINTNHPDFIGGNTAISMLEKKNERKRREGSDRVRRNPPIIHHATSAKNSVVGPSDIMDSVTNPIGGNRQSQSHQSQGRADSGFLTYFFGGSPHNITAPGLTPEPLAPLGTAAMANPTQYSRAGSPSRANGLISIVQDEYIEDSSNRSDEYNSTNPIYTPQTAHLNVHHSSPDREEVEVELIRSLIFSYFSVTKKTIADLIPKTIMFMIVNYARENIQNRLVSTLYREELFQELLTEDPRIMNDRNKCKQLLETYKKGSIVLQDIF